MWLRLSLRRLALRWCILVLPGLGPLGLVGAGCGGEAGAPRGDAFVLLDQDSARVAFPGDLRGDVVVLGFIYTHCPDVCAMTTANMREVRRRLGAPTDVRFVSVTFDPARDTPGVLKRYGQLYDLDDTDWLFLTGDSTTVDRLMEAMGVRHRRGYATTTEAGEAVYFIDHSDQITLLDRRGRVHRHYGGSMTPPEILVEDIEALR